MDSHISSSTPTADYQNFKGETSRLRIPLVAAASMTQSHLAIENGNPIFDGNRRPVELGNRVRFLRIDGDAIAVNYRRLAHFG